MSQAGSYNAEELMAVLFSRELHDFETGACGALSSMPAAGMLLAEATHAPHATVIIRGSPSHYDAYANPRDFHYQAARGNWDLFFVGGIQFDKYGNFNLHYIGDPDAPEVRMPGAMGTALLYYVAKRVILFRDVHNRRVFVEEVSFKTGAASTEEFSERRDGATKCITPMATMNLNTKTRLLELESVHPGYTFEDVQANTGFELPHPNPVPTTAPPTQEELHVLRTVVKQRMLETGTYPEFAKRALQPA